MYGKFSCCAHYEYAPLLYLETRFHCCIDGCSMFTEKGGSIPISFPSHFAEQKESNIFDFFLLANLVDCLEHQILISLLSCNCFVLISFWFSLMTRVHFYTYVCVVLTVLEVIRKSLFCS